MRKQYLRVHQSSKNKQECKSKATKNAFLTISKIILRKVHNFLIRAL